MSGPEQLPLPAAAGGLIPVAAYVRMSTEHQQYSTENQLACIKDFATHRGMQIARVFADEGKSGLSVRGRDSLQRMIAEVESGAASFHAILVYDVSRWGRFQDTDESGFIEYRCKRTGIAVHYCAEQFENDGSPASNIIKSVKRSMAGEYSRELSTKVFQGACRLIQLGFKQGGMAGYGLRRMVLDPAGRPKGILEFGQQKFLATDRVVFVPGPEAEQAIVREIFAAYVHHGRGPGAIAAELNRRQVASGYGRPWTDNMIHTMLTNENYIGNLVYHRSSGKLQHRPVRNPPELWIRADGVFPAIVDPALFAGAQAIMRERAQAYTEEELLTALRNLWARGGRLSASHIDADPAMPCASTYMLRFGSLLTAYQRIGYHVRPNFGFRAGRRRMQAQRREFGQTLVAAFAARGLAVEHDPARNIVRVAGELIVAVVVTRCYRTKYQSLRWSVPIHPAADLTLAVRLNVANEAIQDYFMFPRLDRPSTGWLRPCNHQLLDAYRFRTLEPLLTVTERILVEDAA